MQVQIILGFQGLLELARRSGQIETIAARAVYANDPFDITYGIDDSIAHKPTLAGSRGDFIGAYAVAKLKGGGYQFEWMTAAEIYAVRDASQGYQAAVAAGIKYKRPPRGNPWIEHFEPMARKTLIRRICKYLPISVELASAVELDEKHDRGERQQLNKILEGVDYVEVASAEDEDGAGDDGQGDQGQQDQAQAAQDPGPQGPGPQRRDDPPPRQAEREQPRAQRREDTGPALPLRGGNQSHALPADDGRGQQHAVPTDDGGFGGME